MLYSLHKKLNGRPSAKNRGKLGKRHVEDLALRLLLNALLKQNFKK
jgi:hypothetical protein